MIGTTFLAHIPLLRIETEQIPFGGGILWQMPFEIYNDLTLGAYKDHKKLYEETKPVFFQIDLKIDDSSIRLGAPNPDKPLEMKIKTSNWQALNKTGFGLIHKFHVEIIDNIWAALMLAMPATALPSPRLSVSFSQCTDGFHFYIQDDLRVGTMRLQGDADLEYLFLSEAAGPPLSKKDITYANTLVDKIDMLKREPELSAALRTLLSIGSPLLSPEEKLTLTTVALEALMLPEVRSGLARTFANRISKLLSTDADHYKALRRKAKNLYKLRSASLHGEKKSGTDTNSAVVEAHGPQLLAAAILELGERISPEVPIEKFLEHLDKENFPYWEGGISLPLAQPPGLYTRQRIGSNTPSRASTFSTAADMSAAENFVMAWSPLIGLIPENSYAFGQIPSPALMPLNGSEIITLEERNVARDFVSSLSASKETLASVLSTMQKIDSHSPHSTSISLMNDHLSNNPAKNLIRDRDLGVIALRLAGWVNFHDPELLGTFIYEGSTRYRQPTVFRQTLLSSVKSKTSKRFTSDDVATVSEYWKILSTYDDTAQHPEVDHVFSLFRHALDTDFQPIETSMILLFSALEAMLGRFRKYKDPVQLENLVTLLSGKNTPHSDWFSTKGRACRNAIAHGYWKPNQAGLNERNHLINVIRDILPEFVRIWTNCKDRSNKHPCDLLVNTLTEQFLGQKRDQ